MPAKSSRKGPASIPPTAFDPTDASGRPKPLGPRAQVELAFETAPLRKVATYQIRYEDKVVSDALQAWHLWRYGKRVTQWELYSIVLAAALENRSGPFVGALEVL